MKAYPHPACLALAFATALSSCIVQTDPVPEMPYRPRAVRKPTVHTEQAPIPTTTWETAPTPSGFITSPVQSTETPSQTDNAQQYLPPLPDPPPDPEPTPEPGSQPESTQAPVIKPLELETLTPSSASSAVAPSPTISSGITDEELKNITNTGPIPTAMLVDGDPTRVWNPLDPNKKIRIIDPKTNQPYPSGKKLKVRKTNFYFYVP